MTAASTSSFVYGFARNPLNPAARAPCSSSPVTAPETATTGVSPPSSGARRRTSRTRSIPALDRHIQIREDEIGVKGFKRFDRFRHRRRRAYDEAALGEAKRKQLALILGVVDEENADAQGAGGR